MTSPTIRLIQRKRRIKRKLRRQARGEGSPLPLSLPAITVIVAGYLICLLYSMGNMAIGFPLTWPHWHGSEEGVMAFVKIGQVLKWLTSMLGLWMLAQVIAEFRRPRIERQVRKARRTFDLLALIIAGLLMVLPWQVDQFVDLIPPAETAHTFEYNFDDQKWHFAPPTK